MNEQLQIALAELIKKTTTGIDMANGFLQAQIPDVIQQLLIWHAWYNFGLFVFAIVWFIIVSIAYYKIVVRKVFFNDNFDKDNKIFLRGFWGSFCTFIVLIPFFENINVQWLQIWIAPKIWLLEYAEKFIK